VAPTPKKHKAARANSRMFNAVGEAWRASSVLMAVSVRGTAKRYLDGRALAQCVLIRRHF